MIGRRIAHYEILEKLGEGGMGVVYKAQDLKLGRVVALKFLPHHLIATAESTERFLREARAAAALDHPNICTVYEVGEEDGQTFIAMAFIEGETLEQKVKKSGPLDLVTAVAIAEQIGEGLRAAHEKGIVHRDIKSANIMVTPKGQVKVMDFGLAKSMGRSQLTRVGETLGTAAYISPEQARGEAVDQRADIWAVGIVLYEMLTSKVPFASDYEQAVIYAILHETPPKITESRNDIPSSVDDILARSLEKDPAARYQSLDELLMDLHQMEGRPEGSVSQVAPWRSRRTPTWRARLLVGGAICLLVVVSALVALRLFRKEPSSAPEAQSIAVADFENGTDDRNLGSLSGLLITSLEQSHRLAVMTRSTMFDYLRQMGKTTVDRIDETIGRDICSRAGTQLLVVPSVHKLGERYIIEVKVLNPSKGEYLFTDKVDGIGLEKIYPMIDEIAERTRRQLLGGSAASEAPSQKLADVAPLNLEAYQHYFQGEQLQARLLFKEAGDEFRDAIVLDTSFAQAYLELARSFLMMGKTRESEDALQHALRHVDRAPMKEQIEIRAATAEDATEREKLYSGLTEKYPDQKMKLFWTGDTAFHRGHFAVAVPYFEKVLALDPSYRAIGDAMALEHVIWAYRDLHQYDKMEDRATQFVAMVHTLEAFDLLADAHSLKGDLKSALQTYERAEELYPGNVHLLLRRGEAYVMGNDFQRAQGLFQSLLATTRTRVEQREGWRELSRLRICQGRFPDALACCDSVLGIDRQIGDSFNLMVSHIQKAFWLAVGIQDSLEAQREVERGLELESSVGEHLTFSLRDAYIAMHEYQRAGALGEKYALEFTTDAVKAYTFWAQKVYDSAAEHFQTLTEHAHVIQNRLYSYDHARLLEETGQDQQALEVLRRFHSSYEYSGGAWCAYYPRSVLLRGRILEKLGDRNGAAEATMEFLALWKSADKGLPELDEARRRLKRLGVSAGL
jgi:serine/threonine protein kinase/tetratricopeptide (TPR) repeat protein